MTLVDPSRLAGPDTPGIRGLLDKPLSIMLQETKLGPGQWSAETLGDPFPGPGFT